MYVGIEFFIGFFIGLWLYRRYFNEKFLAKIKNYEIDHKRDEAMERLIAMDEYRRITNEYKKDRRKEQKDCTSV